MPWLIAQTPTDLSPLAQYGMVGALLSIMFAFMWFVIKGYREDISGLKQELREGHLWLRDRGVPALEAAAAAVTESNRTMAEMARVADEQSKALAAALALIDDIRKGLRR